MKPEASLISFLVPLPNQQLFYKAQYLFAYLNHFLCFLQKRYNKTLNYRMLIFGCGRKFFSKRFLPMKLQTRINCRFCWGISRFRSPIFWRFDLKIFQNLHELNQETAIWQLFKTGSGAKV